MLKKLSSMVSFSIIAVISTFIFQTVTTHILSVNDYGVFAKWLTDISYMGIFFVLGLDSSLLYHAKKGESIQENMTKNFLVYFLALSLSIFFIIILPIEKIYYFTLTISVFFFALIGMVRANFQYYKNFKIYNLLLIIRPIVILIAFGIIFYRKTLISYNYAMITYSLMSLLVGVAIFTFYLKNNRFVLIKKELFVLKYYTYGFKSILNSILAISLYASTIYCISYFLNFEIIAFFFVASSISKMVWVVPDSAGNLLYPSFLRVNNESDKNIVLKEMFYYAQIVFMVNILCLIFFGLFGVSILRILYEDTYTINYIPILILLFGNQGMVYYKLISRYLAANNNWKPLYLALGIGVLVNIVSNIILLPSYGLIGACISTSLSFWSCGIVASYFLKNSLIEFLNLRSFFRRVSFKNLLNY